MTRNNTLYAFTLMLLMCAAPLHAEDDHHGHEHGDDHGHEEPEGTEINKEVAEASGIRTEVAGSAIVTEAVTLTGRITLNDNTLARVKARFGGIVRDVKKGQGETVKADEVLATVESNESLQVYAVKSPISGVILARNTNVGDVAGDAPLFTIADMSNMWAEFHVFARDIDRIRSGQTVSINSVEGKYTVEAPISVILPLAEASSQTVVARVTLPNANGIWRSGMTVRGDVAVSQQEAKLAVKTSALQRMEGKSVVFVAEGDRYEPRPVKTGRTDKEWTEVLEGLKAGESYVSENSFLIKADIGKSGAEHTH